MLTQTQISLGISIILFIFSAINFWQARRNDVREDTEGTLKANLKLDSLCASMSDTRVDIKGLVESTNRISEKQIRLEQEMSAAWKRIDENRATGKDNHEKIEVLIQRVNLLEAKED